MKSNKKNLPYDWNDTPYIYNMFVRLNMQQQPVYLTKHLVERGACVVAPYSISQGTLPAIVVTSDGTNDVTDIAVGSLTINEQTTVAQFANAVVVKGKHSSRLSRTVPLLPIYLWRYAKPHIFTTLRIFCFFFRISLPTSRICRTFAETLLW